MIFGLAGGPRLPIDDAGHVVVVGPEIYGETAFRAFFDASATGVEGLLSARFEGTGERGPQLRVKLGVGGGVHPQFGAPQWRLVLALEVFDHNLGQ
jgi:hypothetical protein